jgi:hypothetical protein
MNAPLRPNTIPPLAAIAAAHAQYVAAEEADALADTAVDALADMLDGYGVTVQRQAFLVRIVAFSYEHDLLARVDVADDAVAVSSVGKVDGLLALAARVRLESTVLAAYEAAQKSGRLRETVRLVAVAYEARRIADRAWHGLTPSERRLAEELEQ